MGKSTKNVSDLHQVDANLNHIESFQNNCESVNGLRFSPHWRCSLKSYKREFLLIFSLSIHKKNCGFFCVRKLHFFCVINFYYYLSPKSWISMYSLISFPRHPLECFFTIVHLNFFHQHLSNLIHPFFGVCVLLW